MAPKARVVSSSSSTSSPSRPPESPIEILYNTAVQSFVRRDHSKTQATLAQLIRHCDSLNGSQRKWYDLEGDRSKGEDEGDDWKIKVLKLVISANASIYSDPAVDADQISADVARILPPASPETLLEHTQSICLKTLGVKRGEQSQERSDTMPGITGEGSDHLLPPAIVSTLVLASLKLKPAPPALNFAHQLVETWLSGLPDAFIRTISNHAKPTGQLPQVKKRIESYREGYLKVIELFVGEVLAREGEFEMARALLDGEIIMSSKRKEDLYRHLRTTEMRLSSSPSNSGILPPRSPSSSLVLPSNTPTSRSRSSTTSSSSSERTARPNQANANGKGLNPAKALSKALIGAKGKQKESETEEASVDTHSTFHVPNKIYINPSNPENPRVPARRLLGQQAQQSFSSLLDLIPPSIRKRLWSSWALRLMLPVPLVIVVLMIWIIRRRRKAGGRLMGAVTQAVVVAGSTDLVQERLKRVRGLGAREWFRLWLRWWWRKLVGVWTMGTSITYV